MSGSAIPLTWMTREERAFRGYRWPSGFRLGVVRAVRLCMPFFCAPVLACALAAEAPAASVPCGHPVKSADGSTIRGSACADRIVVTSPEVETVIAGEGNDVIFVNPDVVEVVGGGGDDVIHGELLETEVG